MSAEERAMLRQLAPLRTTLERLVTQIHGRSPRELDDRLVAADVERCWTLVLEGYRQGVETVQRGLHRAEGLDHELIDEAVEYGMRTLQQGRGGR